MLVGNEHGQREPVQHPLRGALPVGLAVPHRDQLADERQRVLPDSQLAAQPGAQVELAPRDVVLALFQAAQLRADLGGLLGQGVRPDPGLGQCVLVICEILLGGVTGRRYMTAPGGELLGGLHRVQARGSQQGGEALGLVHPGPARLVALGELALDLGEPVSAVAGQFDPQPGLAIAQAHQRGFQIGAPGLKPRPLRGDPGQLSVDQPGLEIREVVRQRRPLSVEGRDLRPDGVVPVAVLEQRGEPRKLRLRPAHRLVRFGQVLEVRNDVRGGPGGVERLEHVVADEVGEIPDRLHRDGLVEQLHRLLRFDPEAAAEVLAVVGKAVVHLGPGSAQLLAQRRDVGAEAREVGGDGHRPVRRHV